MKNSNIIISVIIVLCIAGGVTAYQVLNPDNGVFSNLQGFTPSESEDSSVSDSGSDSTGTGESGDSNGQSSGSSGSVNSGSGGSGNGGSRSSGSSGISSNTAKEIATKYIAEAGAYAGTPEKISNGNWVVPIFDKDGNRMGGAEIDSKGNYIGLA